MIQIILRVCAIIFLMLSVVFAVLDGARSIGAAQPVSRSLLFIWSNYNPESVADAQTLTAHYIGEGAWEKILVPVLAQPGWFVFGVLALLFYIAGYRRKRPLGRFTA
ncbi:hypothetical protein AAIB41_07495 [Brucella sp. BE17]|uniref:hypothetical protein n=1 Tax=Brucella sp. BE17 TaxID=3142977 RepID=UPI0031BA845D